MKLKKLIISATTGVLLFCGAVTNVLAIGPFTNGSFENGTDPGSYTTISTGGSNITDWSVVSGNIDYIGTYWQSAQGNRSIDMNGNTAGAISQTFTTIKNHKYVVTFDLSGNPDGLPHLKTMKVNAAGMTTPYSYNTSVYNNTKTNMKWQLKTFSFVATDTTTTLKFTSTTDPTSSFGPALDNVNVGVNPASFGDCKNYSNFVNDNGTSFANIAECLTYVTANLHRTDGSIAYTAYSLNRNAQWGIGNDGNGLYSAVGAFGYTDANHDWYIISAKDLNASGNTAWFAGKVTNASQPSWIGQWLFAEVKANSPKKIWGSFTDQSTAENGVVNMTNPSDGPFDVISGSLSVH